MMKHPLTAAFAVMISLLTSACGIAEVDWNNARAANTLAAYQSFLREHPSDPRADNARGRIFALRDDQAWAAAMGAHSAAGFHEYLKEEPGSSLLPHGARAILWPA
jgi:hypothetical protein